MDDEPTSPQHKIVEHNATDSAAPQPAPIAKATVPADPLPAASPFTPRPAVEVSDLPAVQDHDRLRLATSAVVQQGLSLDEAAERYGVDPDALHVWHRTYVNFIGKDLFAATSLNPRERIEIDEATSRKFDDNWDEMMRLADLERPQPSPLRKSLLGSPLTSWMFRDDKVDAATVIGAVAVLAFSALAIRAGTQHIGEGKSDGAGEGVTEEPPEAFDPKDPELLGGEKTDVALTQIAEVLEIFSKLETWQERLPYHRNPERVKPLMEAYYKKHPDGPLRNLIVNPEVSFIQRKGETFILMKGGQLTADGEEGKREQVLLLAELRKGDPCALFDWEVLVNYQPISWGEFVASKSTVASPFRVRVAREEYYVKPFMDEEKFVSFGLLPLGEDRKVYGFVRRGSDLEKQLSANVSRELKGNRAMILNLRFPQDAKYDNVIEIESLAADSWLGE